MAELSLADNVILGAQRQFAGWGGVWRDRKRATAYADELIERFGVRAPGPDFPVGKLSGGNLQKVVLGRELTREPLLLLVEQPTRGLDVGAIEAVWAELLAQRARGRGILLVSAELDEILNLADRSTEKGIMEGLEAEDPDLVEQIRRLMFVFEDLLLIDATAMKELVAKIDRKLLTIALKGTSDQLKNHFMQCMSQRGGEMLREDMDAAGPVRIRDVEAAQQQILAVVQQLESEGVLSLKGGGGDQYVV